MPRGDGTGPFGKGPLNQNSRGTGRGSGRRRNMSPSGNCPRNSTGGGNLLDRQNNLQRSSLLQGAVVKLLGLALAAVPAILKARNRLPAPDKKKLSGPDEGPYPTIEVKPIPVDEQEKLK